MKRFNVLKIDAMFLQCSARHLSVAIVATMIWMFASSTSMASLVGYWNFDDNVLDQSGTGNDGALGGAAFSFDVPGVIGSGKSLDFGVEGDNKNVFVPANGSLNSSIFTLSMWINDRGQTTGINRLISRGGDSFEFGLNRVIVPKNGQLSMFGSGIGGWHPSSTTPTANTWLHVALVSNGTSVDMFLDGNPVAALSVAGLPSPTGNLRIGARENTGPIESINGLMDDVALFNSVLTPGEIAALASGSETPLTVIGSGGPSPIITTVVSNTTDWKRSTVSIDGGTAGVGTWPGVGSPTPAVGTFTETPTATSGAVIGHINTVANAIGAIGLTGELNVHYYRTTFDLDSFTDISANITASMDNGGEIWINGQLVATSELWTGANWGIPYPTVTIADDGTVSGNQFNPSVANFSGFVAGTNEIIVALRNPNAGEPSPAGGFAFRMDVTTTPVPEPSSIILMLVGLIGFVGYMKKR